MENKNNNQTTNEIHLNMNGSVIESETTNNNTSVLEIEEDEPSINEDITETEILLEEPIIEPEKKRSKAVIDLEKKLLKTTWVDEAELIQKYVPSEDLTKNQQKLLQKCINKEEFTDKQFSDLKILLNKYRALLQKLRPDDTIQNVEDAVQLIQTEADFIEMMSAERNLLVHINTRQGKKGFEFTVLPINDSRIIDSLDMQIDLFRDFSVEEQMIYSKSTMGQELTPEEQRIYNRMNQEIIEKQSTERIKTINSFLANQLIIKGSDATVEQRERFWELFPFNSKIGVFIRVQDMLGLSETKNSELFPLS
ncbi:hypothetical protein [Methanobrevibacter sp.]